MDLSFHKEVEDAGERGRGELSNVTAREEEELHQLAEGEMTPIEEEVDPTTTHWHPLATSTADGIGFGHPLWTY